VSPLATPAERQNVTRLLLGMDPPQRREVRIRRIAGRWCWVCTLCCPAVHGATRSWPKTLRNVTRHCTRTRRQHHDWVRRTHGRWL
jgi:hypothetical protein